LLAVYGCQFQDNIFQLANCFIHIIIVLSSVNFVARQLVVYVLLRKVWRYQMGDQKSYIEGQTIQWPKEKKDKRTNNHLQNTTQQLTFDQYH
jgi:hypothetical protein